MAYKYKENEDYKAGADGILMSDDDYTSIQGYKDAWSAAKQAGDSAGMQAAHDAAEALRAKYGYSGGGDGSQYLKKPESQQFTYESAPSYTSKYKNQIDELTQQILGREAFSYDPTTDPRYAAYKKEYAREGQRAAADTMGQYAAMTGGMPSTAAVTASQQAGDYYAAQMADKIPELYQLAYSMYQDEGDRQRADLEMLMALEQGDYNKYLALLDQYNTDRSFAYGQFADNRAYDYQAERDAVSDQRYDTEWNYQVGRDQIADSRYESETAYNKAMYLLNAGAMPDAAMLKAAGMTTQQAAAILAVVQAKNNKSLYGNLAHADDKKVKAPSKTPSAQKTITGPKLTTGDEVKEVSFGDGENWNPSENVELNWDSMIALGLGPVSATTVAEIQKYGGIVEDGKGNVYWAKGWNPDNYKEKMKQNKSGLLMPNLIGLTGF